MAVKVASSNQTYQGLSSDEKPAGASNGDLFHAVDTGEQWVFHDGVWTHDLRIARALEMLP